MKALATLALLLTASAAGAQPALPRADVQAAIGWQNLRADSGASSNDWINSIAVGDAAAGWYWTEHLRTQIDVGLGSSGRSTKVAERPIGNRPYYQIVDTNLRPATLAISQQYQFFHNALFQPHVGAGIVVRSDRLREDFSPVVGFDPVNGQSFELEPRHSATRTRAVVLAVTDLGFKAYLSQRAFFVTDARLTIRHNVDGVLFRFGFGVDF